MVVRVLLQAGSAAGHGRPVRTALGDLLEPEQNLEPASVSIFAESVDADLS